MSNQKRDYDSTVARIAGNIMSGALDISQLNGAGWTSESMDAKAVAGAVAYARAIVEETKRTEPKAE